MKYRHPGALALLVSAFAVMSAGAAPSSPERSVSKTLPVTGAGPITLDTYKGTIHVTAWDRADVAVEARIAPDDSCGSEQDQKKWMDATRVVIEPSGGGVRIASEYDDLESAWHFFGSCTARPFVNYRVSVPRNATVKIHDYKSEADLKGLAGHLTLVTYKGTVALSAFSGGLDLETYKGEVHAAFDRVSGDVRVETYKGEVDLTFPAKSAFELSSRSGRRGRIASAFEGVASARDVRNSGSRSSATVNGGGPRVTLATEKGSLELRSR